MPITLEQAKSLRTGTILTVDGEYYAAPKQAQNKQIRVSGTPKLWARNPDRIRIPVKYGLYNHGELTNGTFEGTPGFTLHLNNVSLKG